MDIQKILVNFVLAFILFCINGVLGNIQYKFRGNIFSYSRFLFSEDENNNYAGNYFQKIINPTIYLAIICVVLQQGGSIEICYTTWLIIPMYCLIRLLYIVLKDYCIITAWSAEIASIGMAILLGEIVFFFLIVPSLKGGESIFISPEDFKNAVWFSIFAYIVKIIWDIGKISSKEENIFPISRKETIIFKKYDKFAKKYGKYIFKLVSSSYPRHQQYIGNFICLLYAVMIYEDHNRPYSIRFAERLIKKIHPNRKMTLGIMQVATTKNITDMESIEEAVNLLLITFLENLHNLPVEHTIELYNPSEQYYSEVKAIYETLLRLLYIDEIIDDTEAYTI